jgi:hypothetical protein
MIIRWIVGLFKNLVGLWDGQEWRYYAATAFDPKLPAYQRWGVRLKDEAKPAANEAERLMPLRNYTVILDDKFGQSPEDIIFFTTALDKAQAVLGQYEKELRSRTSGDFYYSMVKNRQLDFFHNFRAVGNEPLEGTAEIDEETEREKFLR